MTTLGKVLVILVFIAAIALGGLMVYVAKTTPNWKIAVKERDDKIRVYQTMHDQEVATRQKLVSENERMHKLLDGSLLEKGGIVERLKLDLADKDRQIAAVSEQKRKAELLASQAQIEAGRLQNELDVSQNVVREREKTLVKLQEDVAQARHAEQAAKNDLATTLARNKSLYDQVMEIQRVIAEKEKATQSGAGLIAGGVKDATYFNPPPVQVRGQIDQVDDKDGSRVKITIGSDSGLRTDHTLEVFRTAPKGQYLGRLLIVETDFQYAIGKLLRQPGVSTAVGLRPGDTVATSIKQKAP